MDAPPPSPSRPPRHTIHRLRLTYLVIPPVILAVLTFIVLFQHSDTNLYMLWSQCHSRSRLPFLSRWPVLGTPLCFLVSFFQEAVASDSSSRAVSLMSGILSFLGGLITVSTVEAARVCNAPSALIAYPTGPWLAFTLVGGAFVWELVILPAFFHRSRSIILARRAGLDGSAEGGSRPTTGDQETEAELLTSSTTRHLARTAEIIAIPAAVALGFFVPSILMLTVSATQPWTVLVWLFFPVWVSLLRQGIRALVVYMLRQHSDRWQSTYHLDSSRLALAGMYALPVLASVAAHVFFLVDIITQRDDRKEMTRSTTKFIVIDAFFLGLTVLYWLFIEAGWRVTLVTILTTVVFGPGAGICVGWVYRERKVDPDHWRGVRVVAVGQDPEALRRRNSDNSSVGSGSGRRRGQNGTRSDENTPLLR